MEEQKFQFEATLAQKESEKQAALEAAAAAASRAQEMAAASRSNTAEDGAPTPVAAPAPAARPSTKCATARRRPPRLQRPFAVSRARDGCWHIRKLSESKPPILGR